ncbi:hypothetical protein WR25_13844 [Diploscapter pachys]|uniref:Uncharacterized protein n=1 Tax=Diploscapter pachys TaxID=2018661 RepID=A0A2A2KYE1_9BILA|nr:hypothetical protein WR25_13844 [Diploscapter pachys]
MSKEKEKGKLDDKWSEKDEKKKTKSASPLDSKKEAMAELAASLFLIEWTNTALDVYVKQIRQNYLKPLKEHVTKLKEDEQKDENQSMVARLRKAAEKLNDWEDSHRRSQYTRNMACSNKEI